MYFDFVELCKLRVSQDNLLIDLFNYGFSSWCSTLCLSVSEEVKYQSKIRCP